ncbi:MAG: 30S ribosomal protein S27e [Candidatus Altiarchaeota archaeon]|nr:30S ribosomal protein S27e [Candidatus Altiarchaeota archaeon]
METIQQPRSKFLKVECKNCGNQQIVFDKASARVNCLVCNALLAKPTGGKATVLGTTSRAFD